MANLGFLERENAAILNASILVFARKTINAFRRAMGRLKLTCPIFLTQNDGTVLPAQIAARLPIRTFSSGSTNSMCSAKFLAPDNLKQALLVVDIGGTTTDCGMLLASGFPRQAAATTEVAGIRMNYSCPDVKRRVLHIASIAVPNQKTALVLVVDLSSEKRAPVHSQLVLTPLASRWKMLLCSEEMFILQQIML